MSSKLIESDLIADFEGHGTPLSKAIAADLKKMGEIANIDCESALVKARKVLEQMLQAGCRAKQLEPGTRSVDSMRGMLQRSRVLPPIVERHCRVIADFGNLAAHEDDGELSCDGGAAAALSMTEVLMCAQSLQIVGNWFLKSILPQLGMLAGHRMLGGAELTEALINDALAMDTQIYTPEFRADLETCLRWRQRNPEIYTAIQDNQTGKLIGYINAMPLTDAWFEKILEGTMADSNFPDEAIREYDLPDLYKLHIVSFAIDPAYQKSDVFKLLYEGFLSRLMDLARREIFFTEVSAYASTAQGTKLAEYVGMTRAGESRFGFGIYKLSLLPPSLRNTISKSKSLITYYNRKYEDLKGLPM